MNVAKPFRDISWTHGFVVQELQISPADRFSGFLSISPRCLSGDHGESRKRQPGCGAWDETIWVPENDRDFDMTKTLDMMIFQN